MIMKQFFVLMILCMWGFTACSSDAEFDDPEVIVPGKGEDTITELPPLKGMCIFAGQVEIFTAADWDALAASPITDFIIIPKEAAHYGATEAGYKTQLAPFMLQTINQIVSRNSAARVWIGTPGISSLNYSIAASSYQPILNYLGYIREQLGTTKWNKNIGGVYMNQESVYGDVNYSDLMANSCIKLMNDLAYAIRKQLKSRFLWIPYYGYGSNAAEIIKRVGYVTNRATIFDYVVIQPHYYFDETVPSNITGVKQSVSKQSVCYRDGVVVTPKLSKTIVGAEIEMSWKVVPPNNYPDFLSRYNEYVNAFAEYKNKYPVIYYWDGNFQNALKDRMVPFFN